MKMPKKKMIESIQFTFNIDRYWPLLVLLKKIKIFKKRKRVGFYLKNDSLIEMNKTKRRYLFCTWRISLADFESLKLFCYIMFKIKIQGCWYMLPTSNINKNNRCNVPNIYQTGYYISALKQWLCHSVFKLLTLFGKCAENKISNQSQQIIWSDVSELRMRDGSGRAGWAQVLSLWIKGFYGIAELPGRSNGLLVV